MIVVPTLKTECLGYGSVRHLCSRGLVRSCVRLISQRLEICFEVGGESNVSKAAACTLCAAVRNGVIATLRHDVANCSGAGRCIYTPKKVGNMCGAGVTQVRCDVMAVASKGALSPCKGVSWLINLTLLSACAIAAMRTSQGLERCLKINKVFSVLHAGSG